jgi:hypothetical protein
MVRPLYAAGEQLADLQKAGKGDERGERISEMKQKLAEMGVEPGNLYGDEFREFVDREIERWAVVVKNANIPRSKFSSITCDKAKAGILDAGLCLRGISDIALNGVHMQNVLMSMN